MTMLPSGSISMYSTCLRFKSWRGGKVADACVCIRAGSRVASGYEN